VQSRYAEDQLPLDIIMSLKNLCLAGLSIATLSLSGCALLKPSSLVNLQYSSIDKLVMECQTRSRFTTPYVAGEVIQSDSYALISMSAEPPANSQKGELCIVDKRHGNIEITSTDELSFSGSVL